MKIFMKIEILWCKINQLGVNIFVCAVISGRRKYDHISDVLRQLGWLRAEQLVSYHRLCLVKTALGTRLPADIAALFSFVDTSVFL